MFTALVLLSTLICGCGVGGGVSSNGGSSDGGTAPTPAAAPTVTTAQAQNGAVIVSLADSTTGAKIYYTIDGSTPATTSQVYQAPFLVASNLTVNAIASASGFTNSSVVTQSFTPNIVSGTLVWSDEFSNSGTSNVLPNSKIWTYDTGYQCCGNNEQENYCAAGSSTAPCDPNNPNAYLDTTGILHITARNPSGTTYTSARLKTEGKFSFMYGRIEARMMLPESQGMWPAFWLLGNNIVTLSWPGCGELDVMEHIDGNNPPAYVGATPPGYDWIAGSVHGGTSASEANGTQQYHPTGFSAAAWHTYGMIWSKGQVEYYVDDPTNVYATFTPANFPGTWPFDQGPQFILLNLAVGGSWPGNVDGTTVFPGDMQVDYVRIYTN
ncbi:MAG: family 16 glycosylhydrolase [Terracidiphilus sp.]